MAADQAIYEAEFRVAAARSELEAMERDLAETAALVQEQVEDASSQRPAVPGSSVAL